MAIAQLSGLGVTEMRNKLGDSVFTRNRSGQVVRQYVVPANTITIPRTNARDNFATANALWSSLTSDEVYQWNIFAARFTRKNSIAQSYRLTGRSMFVSCNYNLLTCFQSPISTPVFNVFTQQLQVLSIANANPTTLTLRAVLQGGSFIVASDTVFAVSFSPCVSSGINYPKSFFLLSDVLPDGTNCFSLDMLAAYSAVYGAPVTGLKMFARAFTLNVLTGLASKPVTASVIVG